MNLSNVEQARYYMIEQQIRPWDCLLYTSRCV